MPPKKRTAPKSPPAGSGQSPKRQRKKRAGTVDGDDTVPATAQRRRRITWRLVMDDAAPHDAAVTLQTEEEEEDGSEDNHSAYNDAMLRSQQVIDWVHEGASYAGHVDDVVAVNDVFAAKVEEAIDKAELGVVQESAASFRHIHIIGEWYPAWEGQEGGHSPRRGDSHSVLTRPNGSEHFNRTRNW
jgi:hypothetical protein